jgi:hypothetical protein
MSCTPVDIAVSLIYVVSFAVLAGYYFGSRLCFRLTTRQRPKRTTIAKKPADKTSQGNPNPSATLAYPTKTVVIAEGKIGKVTVSHNICLPHTHHIIVRTRTYPFSGLILISPLITRQEKEIDLFYFNASKYTRVFSPEDAVVQLYVVRHQVQLTIRQ